MAARVFVINPYAPTMAPMSAAFARLWPEAAKFDLLDESLYGEVDAEGTISPAVVPRLRLLFEYARAARAGGIIFTGSTFGPAVDQAREGFDLPVLKPDEAMAEAAVAAGNRIAVLATAQRALPVILAGIEAAAAKAGKPARITAHHVPEAQAILMAGGRAEHDRRVVEVATKIADCDVLVLGQISMAPAAAAIPAKPGRIVLTTPDTAVARMKALLGG